MSTALTVRSAAKSTRFKKPASAPVIAASLARALVSPDAELIRLCAAYTCSLDALNNSQSALEPDEDPAWQAAEALEDRLLGLPASTFEGLLAKAQVAQHQARKRDGSEDYSTSHVGAWPEMIVRDLLRLGGMAGGAQWDDGAVLTAFTTYQALKAEERSIEGNPEPSFGTPEAKAREAAFEGLVEKQGEAIETIIASAARTSAGLGGKAKMVVQTLPNAVRSFELNLESDEIRLALSLAADLSGEAQ